LSYLLEEELIQVPVRQARGEARHAKVGVELGDGPGGAVGLEGAQLVHASAQAVEVGQAHAVEVRQAELSAAPLHREGKGHRVAHGQAHDADPLGGEELLLVRGYLVPVAVRADLKVS
jgi:hypothetical protein